MVRYAFRNITPMAISCEKRFSQFVKKIMSSISIDVN